MEQKHHPRLSIEDRETISRGLSANLSYVEIARLIGRPTSTVSREVKNNYGRHAIAAAQLSESHSSLWADDAVVNGSCFTTVGLSVTSIDA